MSMLITPAPLIFTPRKAASLNDKPSSPSSYDDEFESASIDPKWSLVASSGSFVGTDIDPYAAFTSGHRSSHNSYRKSWWMFQPASGLGGTYAYQTVSLPSECFIWARFSFNFRYVAQVQDDINCGLLLSTLASGVPSGANCIWCYLNRSVTNGIRAQGGKIVAGVVTGNVSGDVGAQSAGTDCLSQPLEFVGVQKINDDYHCFVGTGTGNWVHLASVNYTGTVDTLTLSANCGSTAAPGNMIMGCDFVRVKTGRFLP